jgi:hypothetical protein
MAYPLLSVDMSNLKQPLIRIFFKQRRPTPPFFKQHPLFSTVRPCLHHFVFAIQGDEAYNSRATLPSRPGNTATLLSRPGNTAQQTAAHTGSKDSCTGAQAVKQGEARQEGDTARSETAVTSSKLRTLPMQTRQHFHRQAIATKYQLCDVQCT